MNLYVLRQQYTANSTIGVLLNGITQICLTLEPPTRQAGAEKVEGHTAIPIGRYKVATYLSPKHNRVVPLLNDVPGFDYVELHAGNSAQDSLGCILVAHNQVGPDYINQSAELDVTALVVDAIQLGQEVWIEIVNTFPGFGI